MKKENTHEEEEEFDSGKENKKGEGKKRETGGKIVDKGKTHHK